MATIITSFPQFLSCYRSFTAIVYHKMILLSSFPRLKKRSILDVLFKCIPTCSRGIYTKTFRYQTDGDPLAIVAKASFSFQDDYFPELNFVITIIIHNSNLSIRSLQ